MANTPTSKTKQRLSRITSLIFKLNWADCITANTIIINKQIHAKQATQIQNITTHFENKIVVVLQQSKHV